MGCGAIVSAAAECSHPAKQGLVQAFSIYVDTLLVGTSTALIILLTGTYDVTDGAGNLLLDQTRRHRGWNQVDPARPDVFLWFLER